MFNARSRIVKKNDVSAEGPILNLLRTTMPINLLIILIDIAKAH